MTFAHLEEAANYFLTHPQHCRKLWIEARWPDGIRCAHCDVRACLPEDGERVRCRRCRRYFSAYSGTILHGTKMCLANWLFVIWAVAQRPLSSGNQMAEALHTTHQSICRVNKIIQQLRSEVKERVEAQQSGSWWDGDRFEMLLRKCATSRAAVLQSMP